MNKKAILVVSFGSSYEKQRILTLDQIELEVKEAFPQFKIYKAYTSPRIRQVLKNQGLVIDSVEEAMERMKEDQMDEIVVQPILMINGKEYDQIRETVKSYKGHFKKIAIGEALLCSVKDYLKVVEAFISSLGKIEKGEAVVCMGHGVEHLMSMSYAALDYVFKEKGHEDVYMATIESYPGLKEILGLLKKKSYHKVRIIPFMIIAGHHAQKDMQGKEGWAAHIEQAGYQVECVMKGLGELPQIRQLFIEHIKALV